MAVFVKTLKSEISNVQIKFESKKSKPVIRQISKVYSIDSLIFTNEQDTVAFWAKYAV